MHNSLAVLARRRVHALVRKPQPFNWPARDEVLANDLVNVRKLDESVPYRFGIHHDGDSVFALIQTSGGVDSDLMSQPGLLDRVFHHVPHGLRILGRAAAARVLGGPLIGADEHVAGKRRHL